MAQRKSDDGRNGYGSFNGSILVDPARFPSGVRAVADYAHSLSLKFGLYTAQHEYTCQWRPGSFAHEAQDARTYCEDMHIDYLKVSRLPATTVAQIGN